MEHYEACILATMCTVENLTGQTLNTDELAYLKRTKPDNLLDALMPTAGRFIEDEEQETIWEEEAHDWFAKIVTRGLDDFKRFHGRVYDRYAAA